MNQFAHGQRLAELAIAHSGSKTPALLLTTKEDELEGPFETDTHHFVVVCLPRYLREATPNEAEAYLARRVDVYEARMARLEELAAKPELIQEVLTAEQVAEWLTLDPTRSDDVANEMAGATEVPTIDPERAVAVLKKYWELVEAEPSLREALFTDQGVTTSFARWIAENPDEAASALLAVSGADLAAVDAAAGVARLQRFLDEWQANRSNDSEEEWHDILTRESWVLTQLFGAPLLFVKDKVYVGGKQFDNTEGRVTDFLLKNRLTGNVSIVEIKTPTGALLGSKYRQVFPPSVELAGGITQILDQKQLLIANYQHLGLEATGAVPFNPRAVVLLGDIESQKIKGDKVRSFELFRNELGGVQVLTFDELAAKAEAVLELFRATQAEAPNAQDGIEVGA